ncbi:MAG: peptidoglycan DD-metalloendopeptidase family protein [Novosphingobium sp.]
MRAWGNLRIILTVAAFACAAGAVVGVSAQVPAGMNDLAEARAALVQARREGEAARARAEQLERDAAAAGQAADRTAREAAAAAARIQQAEAQIAARGADIRLIDHQRTALRARLAQRQLPVMRLTAALQRLSRRPLIVSLLRPGSLADAVHLRAMLETMLPEVQRRTAALRVEIQRGKALRQQALAAVDALRREQAELGRRRQELAGMETQQRLALRTASGTADREAERALSLAEQARDLDALTDDLGKAGAMRDRLARLPGPVMRPAQPGEARVNSADFAAAIPAVSAPPRFLLPVQGRLIAGFGAAQNGGPASRGVSLAASPGAQAIAPAAGRVAFAGPYRGYGMIVIIDHGGGWTSLVTGLGQADARVGDQLVAGSPLGTAGPGRPVVTLELRRDGVPVNPLDFAKLG